MTQPTYSVAAVLFPDFELLDVFGPLEMLGLQPASFALHLVAERSGAVASAQGPRAQIDHVMGENLRYDVLLVPGGRGTRKEVNNPVLLDWLIRQAHDARYVTSVCTGSALLARAGLLDGVRATTNKMSFDWVASQGPAVLWQRQARWVEDGRFFTSSGVSAGMDMSLALIEKMLGPEAADRTAVSAEYDRHRDPAWDPFSLRIDSD